MTSAHPRQEESMSLLHRVRWSSAWPDGQGRVNIYIPPAHELMTTMATKTHEELSQRKEK